MARNRDNLLGQFDIAYNDYKLNIKSANEPRAYTRNSTIHLNGTGNCQLMVMEHACHIIHNFDKYQIREALIKIRNSPFAKRILLMDLNKQFANKLQESLSPKSIISQTDYISSNGSNMNLTLVLLRNIRQFSKIPE